MTPQSLLIMLLLTYVTVVVVDWLLQLGKTHRVGLTLILLVVYGWWVLWPALGG